MSKEIWKDVKDCEDRYEISNQGKIRSKIDGSILRPPLRLGYELMSLIKNDGFKKQFFIHRLVAQTFIPNPDHKPEVNHINKIRNDNRVENLEWNTAAENLTHARINSRLSAKRTVVQYSIDGMFVAEYPSITEAAIALNLRVGGICNCCRGRSKTVGGFIWKYKKQ